MRPERLAPRACMVSTAHASESRDLLSHGERETEHLFPSASHRTWRPRGKDVGRGVDGDKDFGTRSRVVSADAGQGVFSWPRMRDAASHQLDRLRCEKFPGEVSPPAVLKGNPCALDWLPRPGLRARTVSRGASGVLEWTSMSVSSGSEAPGTQCEKEAG